jgi:hypothetical protein
MVCFLRPPFQDEKPVSSSQSDTNIGRVIGHRYSVEKKIGFGAFGTIYLGICCSTVGRSSMFS